ncbi:class I SAM-dependent methyltransferase [Shimia sp. R11_0]|uniref:class I SAM-dependent methyltransferase n=1 Tax=Shimia sp. R11_0 TaxID=2821096 RepID=UPI001ADCF33F|nr:class I SAM-dependent methyltransferase [Shimia sp. R11_0]MBO9479578.1 class I SAM-dependent methyltransferase [Shimia sp. R11_0]
MKNNRASQTAYTVLQGVVHTGRQQATKSLVSPEKMAACLTILNSSGEGRRRLRQLENPVLSAGLLLLQRLLMPGIARHYVTRKLAIEEYVRSSIAGGAKQVVSIGAGFDTLMYELSGTHPSLTCIELDHPATSQQKRLAFASEAPANLHLYPVDLSTTSLVETLAQTPAFDPDARTCFICEGVLMYLAPADVENLFAALTEVTSAQLQFVFTAAPEISSPNTNATWLLKRYLHRLGEPLKWTIEKEDIHAFLASQGYGATQVLDGRDMRGQYLPHLPSGPFHLGEFVVACAPLHRE